MTMPVSSSNQQQGARIAGAQPHQYPKIRRILHWIGGPLLLAGFAAGAVAHNTDPAGAAHLLALRLHVLLAAPGALLSVLRIIACLKMPGPGPLDLPAWRQRIFQLDHKLLYLSTVLLGLSGGLMLIFGGVGAYLSGASTMPELAGLAPRVVHGVLTKVFLGLVVAHLVGVVSYQFTKGKTFRRMSPIDTKPES